MQHSSSLCSNIILTVYNCHYQRLAEKYLNFLYKNHRWRLYYWSNQKINFFIAAVASFY